MALKNLSNVKTEAGQVRLQKLVKLFELARTTNDRRAALFLNEAFLESARMGDVESMRKLAAMGADKNCRSARSGWNALHIVSAAQNREAIAYLVDELGMNVNEFNPHGYRPRDYVVWNSEFRKYFLDHGAEVSKGTCP
ncbi:MAG: ankyrin repeat domain-containing protein [Candidatus Marsarchaeota archaeon]|nr:ankyrin repeat domain-containing protein [Candidatus Marsarchaeota archaeon]